MADFNSSLPVRTQANGDVVAFLADGTTPSQLLAITAAGHVSTNLFDGIGTALTSQANGAQRALDVISQSAGPVAPGTAAAFSDLIGGQFNTTLPTLTNGQQSAIQLDNRGRVLTTNSNFPTTVDTNYGTVGANTIRTAAQIGNATGAAAFDFGASSAQTLRVAALLGNAAGVIDYNTGTIGAQTVRVAAQIANATGAADFNYGAVGAQTVRTASQIGNATGAANFGNGATGAQTLRVAANLAVAGADVTSLNPVPVTIVSTTLGTEVNKYNTTASVAANATTNHNYAITALKTFKGKMFWASASGKIKVEVQISPDGTTFTTYWVGFNSTANPNISINLDLLTITDTGVGSVVRIIVTNKDLLAQDVYSTISGSEF